MQAVTNEARSERVSFNLRRVAQRNRMHLASQHRLQAIGSNDLSFMIVDSEVQAVGGQTT